MNKYSPTNVAYYGDFIVGMYLEWRHHKARVKYLDECHIVPKGQLTPQSQNILFRVFSLAVYRKRALSERGRSVVSVKTNSLDERYCLTLMTRLDKDEKEPPFIADLRVDTNTGTLFVLFMCFFFFLNLYYFQGWISCHLSWNAFVVMPSRQGMSLSATMLLYISQKASKMPFWLCLRLLKCGSSFCQPTRLSSTLVSSSSRMSRTICEALGQTSRCELPFCCQHVVNSSPWKRSGWRSQWLLLHWRKSMCAECTSTAWGPRRVDAH